FYLDPPYHPATRTARNAYEHEMSDRAHSRLLQAVQSLRAMVVLSGYSHPMYDTALRGWDRRTFDMPNNAGQGKTKQRRTEVLWLNPACERFRLRSGL
ncbi:MAG TPA: hypothetical protein VKF63_13460, partial [Terracidiphilus sp.]|nr:hypothetical protein [Terracidiphilus sp.]